MEQQLLLILQCQIRQFLDDLYLPLVEEQFLVVFKVLFAAVVADKAGAVGVDGQFLSLIHI